MKRGKIDTVSPVVQAMLTVLEDGDGDVLAEAAVEARRERAAAAAERKDGGAYDVDDLNREYAVVQMGGSVVIVRERPDAPASDRISFLRPEGFKLLLANRFTERRGADGKKKVVTHAIAFLTDKRRRSYEGLVFHPSPDNEPGPPGYLNLWPGFSVLPAKGGSYKIFRDHLFTNIAHGDKEVYRWLFAWFAQMVQEPRRKPGTAIVLRGAMGSGKTIVGTVFGSLIDQNYFIVDDPRYVTGNFNSHMAQALLLQAEEAFWAGDKTAEGRLKGLVTSDWNMIEAKGVDPVRMPNYVRVLITSNEDWVVPAGKDERRFAVFDVDPRCAGNHAYFAEMQEELDAGGREALLYELLHFDLSKVNLREIPKTGALLEQKVRSLDPIETWLLDRLKAGTPTRKHQDWPEFIATDAWCDDYIEASERIGIKRKAAQTTFGIKIRKLLPGACHHRATIAAENGSTIHRPWGYLLPPLVECREAFARLIGQEIDWGHEDG